MRGRRFSTLLCLLVLAVAAGCGEEDAPPAAERERATLLLDFTPNAVHAGIYSAVQDGAPLDVRVPGASTDALKLLQAGRVDLAVLDIHDLGLARQGGADLVGVMALVQRPLAAVLAVPEVRRPRDLAGRRAGVTGLPSDRAVLRSVVAGDGGDPDRIRTTTIGFRAVPALLAGRVDGATAFWNVEGVALKARRRGMREFRVDDYGAPSYPELVLCATRRTLAERPALVRDAVRDLQAGYRAALADPEGAVRALTTGARGLDPAAVRAQLTAVRGAFRAPGRPVGSLDPAVLGEWAAWDLRFGILERPLDPARAFDTRIAGG